MTRGAVQATSLLQWGAASTQFLGRPSRPCTTDPVHRAGLSSWLLVRFLKRLLLRCFPQLVCRQVLWRGSLAGSDRSSSSSALAERLARLVRQVLRQGRTVRSRTQHTEPAQAQAVRQLVSVTTRSLELLHAALTATPRPRAPSQRGSSTSPPSRYSRYASRWARRRARARMATLLCHQSSSPLTHLCACAMPRGLCPPRATAQPLPPKALRRRCTRRQRATASLLCQLAPTAGCLTTETTATATHLCCTCLCATSQLQAEEALLQWRQQQQQLVRALFPQPPFRCRHPGNSCLSFSTAMTVMQMGGRAAERAAAATPPLNLAAQLLHRAASQLRRRLRVLAKRVLARMLTAKAAPCLRCRSLLQVHRL